MPALQPQPSINDARTRAMMQVIARLDKLDLTPLLVYKLDTVADGVLPALAWQFDMASPLWALVAGLSLDTVAAIEDIAGLISIAPLAAAPPPPGTVTPDLPARQVLKNAIPLHRTRGTPYAIKSALESLGWSGAAVLEGQSSWGGSNYPANQGWAVCRLVITLAAGAVVHVGDAATIIAAFNFFKPARAILDSLWFATVPLADSAPSPTDSISFAGDFFCLDAVSTPTEFVSGEGWQLSDGYPAPVVVYNGNYLHAGYYKGVAQPLVVDSGLTWDGSFVRGIM